MDTQVKPAFDTLNVGMLLYVRCLPIATYLGKFVDPIKN
jgi:hypothetical protein